MGGGLKFQSVSAFEKHLNESASLHLSLIYMLITPCSYERELLEEKVVRAFKMKDPKVHGVAWAAQALSMDAFLEELNTRQLFEAEKCLILKDVEKLKKREIEQLAHYLERPAPFSRLILSGASTKGLSELYHSGKKEMVLLDLSDEKPWDRQKRLRIWLNNEAIREGKPFTVEASTRLFEQIGTDMPMLQRELEKLICYVGDRPQIDLRDVEAVCATPQLETLWQQAEALVFGGGTVVRSSTADVSWLLMLLSATRSQLQNGLMIASLQEKGYSVHETAHHLPQLRLSALEKCFPVVLRRKRGYFEKALQLHFETELLAKNSSFAPSVLFDMFHLKLLHLKNRYDTQKTRSAPVA